ncbi:hypothetical protein ACUDA9_04830 [Pseudomonas aeruginosa]|uniref:hypothetical protein n=1 Tax=Pseudomonas aeruginosa TaxID=287 RepID=UPI0021AF6426|nr:hypothetical protein [Pseudomonas aeruginosa]HCF9595669.1 hypothetical protein [Pseudomonas aeruginosa]
MTDTNDFDFEDNDDFDFDKDYDFKLEQTITEQDIKAAKPAGETVIKKPNAIDEKKVEERARQQLAQSQYDEFLKIIDDIYEPSSSSGGSELLYQLADQMKLLNGKTFWSYVQTEGKRTKIEEIQYCTWAVLEISKAPIEDRLKVLIMEAINSYIGEIAHGKISWRIALSL